MYLLLVCLIQVWVAERCEYLHGFCVVFEHNMQFFYFFCMLSDERLFSSRLKCSSELVLIGCLNIVQGVVLVHVL